MSAARCTACGHQNPPDSNFCNKCGTRLVAEMPAGAVNYTPRHLAEKILTHRAALEGERKQVTVMFIDVKGSVALSRSVEVEAWHQIMNRFFTILGEAIHDFEGTINQYTGDGVMALFGAPLAHEDHAQRACLAALRIQQDLQAFAAELKKSHDIEFLVRTGLNSGEVVVGKIGDDLRMDYTAKGQSVGLAARMEQLAIPGRIFLSSFTADLLKGSFELRERGEERVKGLRERIRIYELRGISRHRSRFEILRAEGRLTPLVDRRVEMEVLAAALESAKQGRGGLIALDGEPGVGKSRLVHELSLRARAQGVPVTLVHGLPLHRMAPLEPLLEFARGYFGFLDDDPTEVKQAHIEARLAPLGLASISDQVHKLLRTENTVAAAESAQLQMLQIMRAALRAGALKDPALVILENLGLLEANKAVAAFLDDLVEALPQGRTLLVVTYRPDYQSRWAELATHNIQVLRLGPLDRPDAEKLAAQLLGGDRSTVDLAPLLAERSGGNPLFMEELLRELVDSGVFERNRHGHKLMRPLDSLQLPAEIQSVVAARVDRLEAGQKRLLQVAAVIGKQFDVDVLAAVMAVKPGSLRSALEALERAQWIYRDSGERYVFHQGLVREVIYHSQLSEQRQTLHGQVATVLARLRKASADESASLIAHHFRQAGQIETAISWHERAAQWAQGRDLGEALRHWHDIIQLTPQLPENCAGGVCSELRARARVLHLGARSGMPAQELQPIISAGRELVSKCPDPGISGQFLLASAIERYMDGDLPNAHDYAARAVLAAPASPLQAAALVSLANICLQQGDLQAALSAVAEGQTLIGRRLTFGLEFLGRSPLVSLKLIEGAALSIQGDWKAGAACVTSALKLGQSLALPEQQGHLLMAAATLAAERGEIELAIAQAGESLRIVEHTGNLMVQNSARAALGRVCLLQGDWARARTLAEQGLATIARTNHVRHEEPKLLAILAGAQIGAGQPDQAHDTARQAVRRATQLAMPFGEIDARLVLAAAITARRPKNISMQAESELRTAEKLITQIGARGLEHLLPLTRLLLLRMTGDQAKANEMLEVLRERFKTMGLKRRAAQLV